MGWRSWQQARSWARALGELDARSTRSMRAGWARAKRGEAQRCRGQLSEERGEETTRREWAAGARAWAAAARASGGADTRDGARGLQRVREAGDGHVRLTVPGAPVRPPALGRRVGVVAGRRHALLLEVADGLGDVAAVAAVIRLLAVHELFGRERRRQRPRRGEGLKGSVGRPSTPRTRRLRWSRTPSTSRNRPCTRAGALSEDSATRRCGDLFFAAATHWSLTGVVAPWADQSTFCGAAAICSSVMLSTETISFGGVSERL
jgi:hypothetical protein